MSTILLPPAPPWFTIDLVTSVPGVAPVVAPVVAPPDPVITTFEVAEGSEVEATFVDAGGAHWSVGVEQVSPVEVRIVVPTVGMPTGRSMLTVLVRLVGLTTTYELPVYVDRPKAYDVVASTQGTYSVEAWESATLNVQTSAGGVFDVKGQTSG